MGDMFWGCDPAFNGTDHGALIAVDKLGQEVCRKQLPGDLYSMIRELDKSVGQDRCVIDLAGPGYVLGRLLPNNYYLFKMTAQHAAASRMKSPDETDDWAVAKYLALECMRRYQVDVRLA